jgi:hypothetical protein
MLVAARLFAASSITYTKRGTVDSINLDLRITEFSRRPDGAFLVSVLGEIEGRPVRLKLAISDKWTDWDGSTDKLKFKQAEMEILADGEESLLLDELVSRSFPADSRRSMFCTTYGGRTASPREDLERRRIIFWVTDYGLCGDHEIQLALDLNAKSMQLIIFEPIGGGKYRDRLNEVFGKGANKAPEPTSPSVTSRAGARLAPAGAVAHL